MTVKKLIGTIHLWLGLASGLLVFIIAVTGCLYAFQEEIQNLTQPYRFVEPQNKAFLLPSEIKAIADKALPGKDVHAIMYQGKERAAKAIFYNDTAEYYYFVYVNQYDGQVLKVRNEDKGFFRFIIDGHYYLWLPSEIGQPIVATATAVFFVMIVSGLFLWWPRTKNGRKQRFTVKWDARWRRKNYDLHNVIGFYVSWLAIIFAITGLVWGFQWFSKAYYAVISGGGKMVEYSEPHSVYLPQGKTDMSPMDKVWLHVMHEVPEQGAIEVHTPHDDSSSIAVNINPDPSTYWKTDYRYFDQYSLKELKVDHIWGRFNNTSGAEKLMRMNYDIHVGAVLGLPGKILAFCSSLIIASLPVTGVIIWWGRKNKKKPAGR